MRCLPLSCFSAALLPAQNVKTATLANGMNVIIQEDHDIPNVAMYFFYKIGSRNERPGITGISHFFEHMMFNGAKKYGPKQFDNNMEKAGGNNNASTSEDMTIYTDWFPVQRAGTDVRHGGRSYPRSGARSENGRLRTRRGVFRTAHFGRQQQSRHLAEQLQAAAFIAHPYHWPVVGWPSDIEAWTQQDLKDYFRHRLCAE